MKREARVLHVVESYGGGVKSAIESYVSSTPEMEHHLYYRARVGDVHPGETVGWASSSRKFPANKLKWVPGLYAAVRAVRPDVIHAHSSIGGAIARLAISKKRIPIVYTPHCFAFEREDIRPFLRHVYWAVERILASNTSVFAACSIRESRLAAQLGPHAVSVYVPNVAASHERRSTGRSGRDQSFTVGTVGRIQAQKDPSFFKEVASTVTSRRGNVRFVWIGGGEANSEEDLRSAGVRVTGWLDNSSAVAALSELDLYMHTAKWEGFPLAILEAHASGLPVLARSTPSLEGAIPSDSPKTAVEMADRVQFAADDPECREKLYDDWTEILGENNRETQRRRLRAAYECLLTGTVENTESHLCNP